MTTVFTPEEPDASPTHALPPDMALVVTLRSGERIVARLGLDEPAARARLQEVQLGLTGERFVRVSDELVLRSDEVHAVELVHERELSYAAEPWQQGAREGDRVSGEGQDEPQWEKGVGPRHPLNRVRRAVLERVGLLPSAELIATVAGVAGVLIAALVTDDLDAGGAWLVVGLVLAAYIVSRGIAKAGTEHRSR